MKPNLYPDGSEDDCGEEVSGELIVADADSAKVFDFGEETLGEVALATDERFTMWGRGPRSEMSPRDGTGFVTAASDGVARLPETVEKRWRGGLVGAWAGVNTDLMGRPRAPATVLILALSLHENGKRCDLGLFFFVRRVLVRTHDRGVDEMTRIQRFRGKNLKHPQPDTSLGPAGVAKLDRRMRPVALAQITSGQALRKAQTMPFTTRRPSTRGTQRRLFGNKRTMTAYSRAVKSKRAVSKLPQFERLVHILPIMKNPFMGTEPGTIQ